MNFTVLFVKWNSGPHAGSLRPKRRKRWILILSVTVCSALVVLYLSYPEARPLVIELLRSKS